MRNRTTCLFVLIVGISACARQEDQTSVNKQAEMEPLNVQTSPLAELLREANRLLEKGQSQQALILLNGVIARNSNNVEAFALRGQALMKCGYTLPGPGMTTSFSKSDAARAALLDFEVARKASIENADTLYFEGMAWLNQNDTLERDVERELRNTGQRLGNGNSLDASLARLKDIENYHSSSSDQAIKCLTASILKRPQFADAYLARAEARCRAKEFGGAIDDCNQAFELTGSVDALFERARIHALFDSELAAKDVDQVLQKDPKHPRALALRTDLSLRNGNELEWKSNLEAELSVDERNYEVLVKLGNCHLERGEDAQAESLLVRASGVRPGSKGALIALTKLCVKRKEMERANRLLSSVAEMEMDAEVFYVRGNIRTALKRYDDAIVDFTKAIDKGSIDDADAYFMRGSLYHIQGKFANSISDFNDAIRLRPDFAAAFEERGRAKVEAGRIEEGHADILSAKQLRSKNDNEPSK